jgi:hypothetical protein
VRWDRIRSLTHLSEDVLVEQVGPGIEAFVVEKPAEEAHFRRQPGLPNSRSPGPQGRERAATESKYYKAN